MGITYISTWQGWLYLAMAIDLLSRKVGRLVDDTDIELRIGVGRSAGGAVGARIYRTRAGPFRSGLAISQ